MASGTGLIDSTSENTAGSGVTFASTLEKAETARSLTPTDRVSRLQSLTRRQTTRGGHFSHPLSHAKTDSNVIVDFDGEHDPYYPRNWPFRKKMITTALYGFTTMGCTWSTSV